MVQIELVLEPVSPKVKGASKSSRSSSAAVPATTQALLDEPSDELTVSDEAIIEATTEAPDANASESTDETPETTAELESESADELTASDETIIEATTEAPAGEADEAEGDSSK